MKICNRCKRELKTVTSVVRGIGPICWKKIQAEANAATRRPERIQFAHCATIANRIRNGLSVGFGVDGEVVIPDSIEASFRQIEQVALNPKNHTTEGSGLIQANAWTLAADIPDACLVGNSSLVDQVCYLVEIVGAQCDAIQIRKSLEKRTKSASKSLQLPLV